MAYEILVVDDELDIGQAVCGFLSDEGYENLHVKSGLEAIEAVKNRCPDLIILDIWLGDTQLDGLRVLEIIKKDFADVPVLMMSGHGTIKTAISAIQKGAYDFIEKPFKMDRMFQMIERALETARLKREVEELKRQKTLEYGTDKSILMPRSLLPLIDRVATTNGRVMIQGPPGSGLEIEMAAELIHERSKRQSHRFVTVNCASLEPQRMEEKLFGLESEDQFKIGLLEKAHQGTLFLDEVADLSLEVQSKLVRILQEQCFQRVGSARKVQVNVRVLSSSRQDIEALMKQGLFREDLFYRLNVIPFKMPAIKDRCEDIARLVDVFSQISMHNHSFNRKIFSDEALLALKAYDWPGNLQQIKNVVDWAMIMAQSDSNDTITPDMLPAEITLQMPPILQDIQISNFINMSLKEAREQFEKIFLLTQLSRCGGNISHTASVVKMERSALHRKFKSLKIERHHSNRDKTDLAHLETVYGDRVEEQSHLN